MDASMIFVAVLVVGVVVVIVWAELDSRRQEAERSARGGEPGHVEETK